jgi:putative lipoprotein
MITGSVLFRQRAALPPGSVVRVRLEDVSRQDVAAAIVAESLTVTRGEQVPIPFELEIDRSTLDPRAQYALRAAIEIGCALAFATTTSHALPADGATTGIELLLEQVTAQATPLESTRWLLAELEGEDVASVGDERAPHLVFDAAASRVSGSGGCNRLTGSFERNGDDLRFGPMAATRMACAEEVMRREGVFLDTLGTVTRHELEGGTLALLADDRVVARLAASGD